MLRALRLQGFKSFPDPVELVFRPGLTAIVGANGCGKSNLVDAIRWVLGEARAGALRAGRHEDVIFQGTARRRPLPRAEVALLLDNSSGWLPVPAAEVEIVRAVERDGAGEWRLNGAPCRRRDVRALLQGTGLGAHAYLVLEAGMIERLLSERAEERRAVLEEAAAIGGYKERRDAALRRLAQAEADLQRLEDVLVELEAQARRLARQEAKAARARALTERARALAAALARRQRALWLAEAAEAEAEAARAASRAEAAAADAAVAEAAVAQREAERAERERQRVALQTELAALRRRVEAEERERMAVQERRAHAEARLQQLVRERAEAERRRQQLLADAARLAEQARRAAEERAACAAAREAAAAALREARRALDAARAAEAAATQRRRAAEEAAGHLGARRAAWEERGRALRAARAEVDRRAAALEAALAEAAAAASAARAALDAARAEEERATAAAAAARAAREAAERAETQAQEAWRNARAERLAVEGERATYEAWAARGEAWPEAVRSVLQAGLPGVLGPLGEFVRTDLPAEQLVAFEAAFGTLLAAVVVVDRAAARAVRAWFRQHSADEPLRLLLANEAPPATGAWGQGAGGAWVDALGASLRWGLDPLDEGTPAASAIADTVREPSGAVRLVPPRRDEGILARRARLVELRARHAAAQAREAEAEAALTAARQARADAAAVDAAAQHAARDASERRRAAEAEAQLREQRWIAVRAEVDGLAARRADLADAERHWAEEGQALAAEADAIEAELTAARAAAVEREAERRAAEAAWDAAREADAAAHLALRAAAAAEEELQRRRAGLDRALHQTDERLAQLDREADALRAQLEELAARHRDRASSAGATWERIAALEDEARRLAEAAAALDDALRADAQRARAARAAAAEATEARHHHELTAADRRARAAHLEDALARDWGLPWESLAALPEPDDPPATWEAALAEARRRLEELGPVNPLAEAEARETLERLQFLRRQRDDLLRARADLQAAIRQTNRLAREAFLATLDHVRDRFQTTFARLFPGGQCDLRLGDPTDPLTSPLEIVASPGGKRVQRLELLSSGERTLTALALLFALYLVRPAPFCVLDEVDAPLDDANLDRFLAFLNTFRPTTQFLLVTHNPRTMEAADALVGVTMEEPGVSRVVSLALPAVAPA